jgi:hypothetical protein
MSNRTRKHIKNELEKLRVLKAKATHKLTVARVKTMKGFESISDCMAKDILDQLREYASIVLLQLNHVESTNDKTNE